LSWQVKVAEKRTLQFMVEGFNLFNRTNFGSVNNVVGVIARPLSLYRETELYYRASR